MMGKVLVKANGGGGGGGGSGAGSGSLSAGLLGNLMGKPKTGLGGFAAGSLGALQFLTSLADAGANQQDIVSGAGSAAAYGAATGAGAGKAGDALDPSDRVGQAIGYHRPGGWKQQIAAYAPARPPSGQGGGMPNQGQWNRWGNQGFNVPTGFQLGNIGGAIDTRGGHYDPSTGKKTADLFGSPTTINPSSGSVVPRIPPSLTTPSLSSGAPIPPPSPPPVAPVAVSQSSPTTGTTTGATSQGGGYVPSAPEQVRDYDMPDTGDQSMGGQSMTGQSMAGDDTPILDTQLVEETPPGTSPPTEEEDLAQILSGGVRLPKSEPMEIAFRLLKAVVR